MQVNSENEALSASRGSLNNSGEGSDIKGSPSEARTSTLRDPSRPKRAVPPVPSSLGSLKKEEEKELETKQGSVTDDNAESVVLPLASPGTDSFDEGDSNGQQILSLQQQNRALLKQIMTMKQQQHYILSSSSPTSSPLNTKSAGPDLPLATFHRTNRQQERSPGNSADSSNDLSPIDRIKNRLALSELKVRRAHKNYHQLSKRTRELETQNARAERNLLDVSSRLKAANDMNVNLQDQIRKQVAKLKDIGARNLQLESAMGEARSSNKMLVQHTRMCEQRIKSTESQLASVSKELQKSREDGVKWRNDRQDIGKYALSLEEALKKAHKFIEELRSGQSKDVTALNSRSNASKANGHAVQQVLPRTAKSAIKPSPPSNLQNGTANILPVKTQQNSPQDAAFQQSPPPPPPPQGPETHSPELATIHPPPPRSSPVTQEFFG